MFFTTSGQRYLLKDRIFVLFLRRIRSVSVSRVIGSLVLDGEGIHSDSVESCLWPTKVPRSLPDVCVVVPSIPGTPERAVQSSGV